MDDYSISFFSMIHIQLQLAFFPFVVYIIIIIMYFTHETESNQCQLNFLQVSFPFASYEFRSSKIICFIVCISRFSSYVIE